MKDIKYINEQKNKNDWLWEQEERYLYYSYKNKNYILPTLIACPFLLIINDGIVGIILLVMFVMCLCKKNNLELDRDPYILKKRESIKEYRKEYM